MTAQIGGKHSTVETGRGHGHRLPARRAGTAQRRDQRVRQRRRAEGPPSVARDRDRGQPSAKTDTLVVRVRALPRRCRGQPGQRADARRRQHVHRLGRGTVLLRIHRQRDAAVRRAPARQRPSPTAAIASSGPAPRPTPRRWPPRPVPAARRPCTQAGTAPPRIASWQVLAGASTTAPDTRWERRQGRALRHRSLLPANPPTWRCRRSAPEAKCSGPRRDQGVAAAPSRAPEYGASSAAAAAAVSRGEPRGIVT